MARDAVKQVVREMEEVRCRRCGQLLCRIERDGLKGGKALEVKCRCNEMNYKVGREAH